MSTLYRAATYEDRVTIAALHADSWRVTYRGVYRDEFLDRDVLQDRIGVWEGRLRPNHTLRAEANETPARPIEIAGSGQRVPGRSQPGS